MKYDELVQLYKLPLFALIEKSRTIHKQHWKDNKVQLCTLLSIKTGACSEDCGYCAQSSRYHTGVKVERLLAKETILSYAHQAKKNGSTRFCMGAAWRGVRANTKRFEELLEIISTLKPLGMELCVTLGQLGDEEAKLLKKAGVTAYNHNIDTSPEHYPNVVTTHTFQDRLNTIRSVQNAGMSVCCGGILGLNEKPEDRLKMLEVISEFNPPVESLPINCLQAITGTPMENNQAVDSFDLIRIVALARIACPQAKIRLSAGRKNFSKEAQAFCFFAGVNSIFYGEKLLTASNPSVKEDLDLLESLGLESKESNPNLQAPITKEKIALNPS